MPTFTPASAALDRIEVALAKDASSLDLTFDIAARTIAFDSFVEQDNATTDPLPETGYLVVPHFPSEKCADMLGSATEIVVVDSLADVRRQLAQFFFDYQPSTALTAHVFDLATGEPVHFEVVQTILVSGLPAGIK